MGANLQKLIRAERQRNVKFIKAFGEFRDLCRASLNPNISENAVEEMIIQHLLTERLFRRIFSVADFMQRNVVAQEIEKVIAALTSKSFSRDDFLKSLDHFYKAIEGAAATISDFSEKQTFLNTVYERFFQGFSVKVADTHGIVYTPQPLVNFMVASVEHILQTEFGTSLSDREVHILDPFTGTANFIVNIIRRIRKSALPQKYSHELHCNEVMLLPYYVASMNSEHAYFEATGVYKAFEGICLVDTFETAESHQQELALFSKQNAARVERQKKAAIRVVIANPPYNAGQVNENDNNKNRKYPIMDQRVRATYGADSTATLQRKLWDPFVKAIRFAADRIGDAGIVCYVNNDSFVTEKSFDGMRKHLEEDFDAIYVLDLGGNVRKNPKVSGTTHNVFGIQVGVSINLFVRLPRPKQQERKAKIYFHSVATDWRRERKYDFLEKAESIAGIKWRALKPDARHNWLTSETDSEFAEFLPLGSKEAKGGMALNTVFRSYSLGVSTNRDTVVYDFDPEKLAKRVEQFADDYNAELYRWQKKGRPKDLDNFVNYDSIKWSRNLKRWFRQEAELVFKKADIRRSAYRPFCNMWLHYARRFIDELGTTYAFFPTDQASHENLFLATNVSPERAFCMLASKLIPSKDLAGGFGSPTYCFPLFIYSKDGKHRSDNTTPNAVKLFRNHYNDDSIQRLPIFHYCYAILHHPAYRDRYAENLKRELPRIPFLAAGVVSPPLDTSEHTGDKRTAKQITADNKAFWAFAKAGDLLADLHVSYEQQKEYPLKRIENHEAKLDWRVEAMRLSKDRTSLLYNDFLTLSGIPEEVFDYRLGNRSALEWVIDQYRVSKDEHGNIVRDPNRPDDEQYIVRLVGQVITVSMETLKIMNNLPELKFP